MKTPKFLIELSRDDKEGPKVENVSEYRGMKAKDGMLCEMTQQKVKSSRATAGS